MAKEQEILTIDLGLPEFKIVDIAARERFTIAVNLEVSRIRLDVAKSINSPSLAEIEKTVEGLTAALKVLDVKYPSAKKKMQELLQDK